MTHPPDWQLEMYAEEALDAETRPGVESHLVSCRACRRRVVALEDEARALRQLLRDDPTQVAAPQASAHGFTWGLPLALLLVAGLGSALTTILELRLPGASWLRPSSLLGVNEMLFDVLFAIRDDAPGWLEFGLSIAALAGLGTLGAFVSGALLRRVGGTPLTGLALALVGSAVLIGVGTAQPAHAVVDLRLDQDVRIAEGERVEGTLIVSGDSLVIEGVVAGDVLCFSERVSVRGRIEGNLIGGGRELEMAGEVTGSVAFGSELSRIEGTVGGTAYLGADHVTISESAAISRDLFTGGQRIVVEGQVGRDLTGTADHLEVRGAIARDLDFWGRRALVVGDATVGRDLSVRLESVDDFDLSESATIGGEQRVDPVEVPHFDPLARYGHPSFYLWTLVSLVAAFLVGLGLFVLFPRIFDGDVPDSRSFFVRLGIGAAFLLGVPVALALVAITLVGIPAALIGVGVYAVCLYVARILVAALIGRSMLGERDGSLRAFGVALLAGLALVVVLQSLPFVGGTVSFVVRLVGLGLLVGRVQSLLEARRIAA